MGTNDSLGVCVPACLITCAGFVGSWTKLTPRPMVRGTVVESTCPSRKPCAPAREEWMCCGAEATQDVSHSVAVGKVKCVHENPHTCASESACMVSMDRKEVGGRAGMFWIDSLVLNLKLLPHSVACTNPIRSEPTGVGGKGP